MRNSYLMGGRDGSTTTQVTEVLAYSSGADSYAAKTAFLPKRANNGCAAMEEKVLSAGGILSTTAKADMDEFDPIANSWAANTDMSPARSHVYTSPVCGSGGIVVVAGGAVSSDFSGGAYNPGDPGT